METNEKNANEKSDVGYKVVSGKELDALYAQIKPLIRGSQIDGDKLQIFIDRWANEKGLGYKELSKLKENASDILFWIEGVDPVNRAFAWNATPIGIATELKEIGRITTYHSFGYYGFFKPSISKVLAQIPAKLRGNTVAFEIIPPDGTLDEVLTEDGEYHKAETVLYGFAIPSPNPKEIIKRQLLSDGRLEWNAAEEAAKVKTKEEALTAEAAEAAASIYSSVAEIMHCDSGQVCEYRMFSSDFAALFDIANNMPNSKRKEYPTVESVLKKLREELKTKEFGYIEEATVLEQLALAMRPTTDIELAQMGWEREARGMALDVLMKLDSEFRRGKIMPEVAKHVAWQVRPFVTDWPEDQIIWADVTKPIYEAVMKKYYSTEDPEKLLQKLAEERALRK